MFMFYRESLLFESYSKKDDLSDFNILFFNISLTTFMHHVLLLKFAFF